MANVFKVLLAAGCLLFHAGPGVRGNPLYCTNTYSFKSKVESSCGYTIPEGGRRQTREGVCADTQMEAELDGCIKGIMEVCSGENFEMMTSLLPSTKQSKSIYDAMCEDKNIDFECANAPLESQQELQNCVRNKISKSRLELCHIATVSLECTVQVMWTCDTYTAERMGTIMHVLVEGVCQ